MRSYLRFEYLLVLATFLILTTPYSIPHKTDGRKDKVVEKVLSDKEHFRDEIHNKDYDHEAFLGEYAKDFDKLDPSESKKRLGLIVNRIDKDEDGFVTFDELKEWIRYTQNRYIVHDVDAQWKQYNINENGSLSWNRYLTNVYGIADEREMHELYKDTDSGDGDSYKQMIFRDKRRWEAADLDHDSFLNRDEFAAFLHPEEMPHMRELVVLETIEDIDKDHDGKISLQEYISDMYQINSDEPEEPDWVEHERQQFSNYRDKNGDGLMDEDEVKDWVLPSGFDHAEAEARHLIHESDANSDQKLTKEEIIDKYDLFVGSQATDFGEALVRHDEF